MSEKTIFAKIIDREIPADIVYEDDRCLAFRDVNPVAPTHVLIIPKRAIAIAQDLKEDDANLMGHLMLTATTIAQKEGLTGGYRLVLNNGEDGGQSVFHLHLHLIGGRSLSWPPG